MYDGYLKFGGVEVANYARSKAYIEAFMPSLNVRCEPTGLREALGQAEYVSPAADFAPWYVPSVPASGEFYGLLPTKMVGLRDSTRTVTTSELSGDGGVHTLPRHGTREIRVVGLLTASTAEGIEFGWAWLRDIMAGDNCTGSGGDLGCLGHDIEMLSSLPVGERRFFYKAETISPPKMVQEHSSRSGYVHEVDFIISCGSPWAYTPLSPVATLNMDDALNYQDPAGHDCSWQNTAYDDFINDPYYTAISQPPQAPTIKPPNLLNITSWRRRTVGIPTDYSDKPGRVVPVVHINVPADTQQVRLRFYQTADGLTDCDYEGEFLISYIPAGATLKLDGVRREVSVTLADGRIVPGSHLIFGSGGRPFSWPTLGCHENYTMTVDMMPAQAGVVAMLDVAVRE